MRHLIPNGIALAQRRKPAHRHNNTKLSEGVPLKCGPTYDGLDDWQA
jgi:hypothetical protein